MKRKSFRVWIRRFEKEEAGIMSDLAKDIKHDKSFPKGVRSYYELRDYLLNQNACEGALQAFENAWNIYRGG